MSDCGHLLILLVITLAMVTFAFNNATENSWLFIGLIFCCVSFCLYILIVLFMEHGGHEPDIALKAFLAVNVVYYCIYTATTDKVTEKWDDFADEG